MSITVLVGLFFSMMAIRLMMAIESTQGIITSGLYQRPSERVVSMAIGVHKLALMKMIIRIFSRVSMIIFSIQGVYPEIILQRLATLSTLNTTWISNNTTFMITDHDTNYSINKKNN